MYIQAQIINLGLNNLVKHLVCRRRPYVFNRELDAARKFRNPDDMTVSFYSGHTSTAFTAAAFLTKTYADLNPDKKGETIAVGALSLGTAALTGYLRYAAGRHYPTDIIVGAIMGSLIGYLVPELN